MYKNRLWGRKIPACPYKFNAVLGRLPVFDVVGGEMESPSTQAVTAGKPLPEFVRLPRSGPEYYTGLTRSTLNNLILPSEANGYRPPVRSVCLRKPGRARGVRLIHLDSLLTWIKSQDVLSAPAQD